MRVFKVYILVISAHILDIIIFLKQLHGINADEYNDRFWYDAGKPMQFSSRKKNISDQQLFDEISYSFEELVELIEIRHFEGDPTKGKTPNTILRSSDRSFTRSMIREQRTYLKGKCFTFSPDDAIRKKGISLVSITLYDFNMTS